MEVTKVTVPASLTMTITDELHNALTGNKEADVPPPPVPPLSIAPPRNGMRLGMNMSPYKYLQLKPGDEDRAGVERLKPFPVIRFMNWHQVNKAEAEPVGLDYMVWLANHLHAEPWFNMHHLWGDVTVRSFAKAVKQYLLPSIPHIYVEWSNEPWNSRFSQNAWLMGEARIKDRATPENNLAFIAVWAKHAVNDFKTWMDVFSDQPGRIMRVCAGQEASAWQVDRLGMGMGLDNFDAYSCSAYIGHRVDGYKIPDGLDATNCCLDMALNDLDMSRGESRKQIGHLADRDNKLFLGYEANVHIARSKRMPGLLAQQIHSNHGIYSVFMDNLTHAEQCGMDTCCIHTWVKRPTDYPFEVLLGEDQDLRDAHKYRACLDFIYANAKKDEARNNG